MPATILPIDLIRADDGRILLALQRMRLQRYLDGLDIVEDFKGGERWKGVKDFDGEIVAYIAERKAACKLSHAPSIKPLPVLQNLIEFIQKECGYWLLMQKKMERSTNAALHNESRQSTHTPDSAISALNISERPQQPSTPDHVLKKSSDSDSDHDSTSEPLATEEKNYVFPDPEEASDQETTPELLARMRASAPDDGSDQDTSELLARIKAHGIQCSSGERITFV